MQPVQRHPPPESLGGEADIRVEMRGAWKEPVTQILRQIAGVKPGVVVEQPQKLRQGEEQRQGGDAEQRRDVFAPEPPQGH
jgi:hypothetical protein